MPLKESRKGKEKGKECTRKQKVYDSTTSSTKPAGAKVCKETVQTATIM
jgi:hypothetical protein